MEKKLEKLILEFRIYKINIEGRSDSSINSYIDIIKSFFDDMKITTYEQLINVSSQNVRDWLSLLVEKGNVETSRNKKLSIIKQLFLFLEVEKEENIDTRIRNIKFAKVHHKESKYITEELAYSIIKSTKNQTLKAAFIICCETGVRFSELMQITCTDIKNGYARIVGKGGKEREIWFNEYVMKICNRYIEKRRNEIIKRTGVKTDILLLSHNGKPLSRQSFSVSLKTIGKRLGVSWSDELSPHKFRHGYVTRMLNENVPINVVKNIVGHSNISTTDRYSHVEKDQVKEAMLEK